MRKTAKNEKTSLGSELSTEHSYPEGKGWQRLSVSPARQESAVNC